MGVGGVDKVEVENLLLFRCWCHRPTQIMILVLPMRSILILLGIVLGVSSAHAEVLTWDCFFETRVDADGVAAEQMNLIFKVDSLSHRAYMEGNNGIVEVGLHIGDDAFSFTENVASGTTQTTTITRDGEAVHSRNTVIVGEIVASQFFGRCQFK